MSSPKGTPTSGRKRSTSLTQKLLQKSWAFGNSSGGEPGAPQSGANSPDSFAASPAQSPHGSRRASTSTPPPAIIQSRRASAAGAYRQQQRRASLLPVTVDKNDLITEDDDDSSSERRIRIARVMTKQQSRISAHIQEFSKITAIITGTDVTIEVTVPRDRTIEELAKQIEAEYAYKFFFNEEGVSAAQDEDKRRDPLVIGQVYDAGLLALKFEDKIGEVLGYTDRVTVINAFEGESINRTLSPGVEAENEVSELNLAQPESASTTSEHLPEISFTSLEDSFKEGLEAASANDNGTSASSLPTTKARKTEAKRRQSSVRATSSLDDRLQSCLRNKIALRHFSEFCIEEYTIENLLFWLDVEIFQSCHHEIREIYGKYIYLAYIKSGAALQVNISAEVRRDIHWPTATADETVFDEAQEQVYSMIKGHSFVRFEKSTKYQQLLAVKKADRTEFLRNNITGPFAHHFQANLETARNILPILEKAPTPDLMCTFGGDQGKIATANKFRESVLGRTLTQYFPLANRILEGYFNQSNRSTWAEKHRRMHKEKKLAKFFGERPSVELIQKQIFAASAAYLAGIKGLLLGESAENVLRDSGATQESGDPSSQNFRRKKKDKLETFFGDRLPSQQKRVQQIVVPGDTDSALLADDKSGPSTEAPSDEDSALPVETTNELDPEERRILQRRTKKIANMLGESLDEKTISQTVTQPLMQEKLYMSQNLVGGDNAEGLGQGPESRRMSESRFRAPNSLLTRTISNVTTDSLESPISEQEDDVKFVHKKRLDKISSLMGQRIGVSELVEAQSSTPSIQARRPLTQDEKKQFQKKASKLERILGQLPPSEALIRPLPVDQKPELARVRRSLAGLSFLVRHAKDVMEIVEAITDINEEKGDGTSTPTNSSISSMLVPSTTATDLNKEARQKKLKKLRKLLGDNITVEVLIETQILADIESSIEEEASDEGELKLLREEVNHVREEIRRRNDQFRQSFIQEVADEGEEDGAYVLASSNRNSTSTRPKENVPRMAHDTQTQGGSSAGTAAVGTKKNEAGQVV